MKIDKLHIENFGKLSNLDLSFDEDYNQIKKENGWGKTTLTIFLKSMFYGMPASRDNLKMERKKYCPWQGGIFGGSLDFTTDYGKYRIVRQFGKTPENDKTNLIDLTTNKEIELPKLEIGEHFFGIGKDTFEMTAFLPQLKFTSSGSDKISASVLGLEKFKFDLANLSQAIENIKKKMSLLKKVKPKQIEIDIINREMNNSKFELDKLMSNIHLVEDDIEQKEELLSQLSLKDEEYERQLKEHNKKIEEKRNLENDLIKKSDELNSLLLQLDELKSSINNEKPKQRNVWPYVLIFTLPCVILVALLSAFHIINVLVSSILFIIIIVLSLVFYFILSTKLNKVDPEKEKEFEDIKNKKEEIEKNVELLQKSISEIKNKLENVSEIEQLSDNDLESVREQIYNTKISLEKLYSEQNIFLRDKDSYIEKIENSSDEMSQKKEVLDTIEDKLELLNLTQEFLLKANENVSKRFVKPINDAFGGLLQNVNVNGRKFIVDNSFSIKEETEMGLKEFDYSSQGYQDILSFCMRMYLVKEVFKGEKPFIILDDTFVNLDDENLDKIKTILLEFAKEFQIIYICCNSRCSLT